MRRLVDIPDESLWRGDILRLSDNYDLGSGSGPVDLMVCDAFSDGLGLIVVSGYKAGNIFCIFPAESSGPGRSSLETSWLLSNWDKWFCFTYEREEGDKLVPIPVEGTLVLDWTEREIVIKA